MDECEVDRFHVDYLKDMEEEDVGTCRGESCNWCGRFS
jgi:hypothetical protein